VNKKTRERLDSMARAERRNGDRITEFAMNEFNAQHMMERLAYIRSYPARNENAKQQIIERYEHDLATWAGK
jgi:hypothetical protein